MSNMNNSEQLQKHLDDILANTWTAQDVSQEYGVTAMTVHLWRARGLPVVVIPGTARPTVRFVKDEVRAWCKKQKIEPRGPVPRYVPGQYQAAVA